MYGLLDNYVTNHSVLASKIMTLLISFLDGSWDDPQNNSVPSIWITSVSDLDVARFGILNNIPDLKTDFQILMRRCRDI